MNQDDHHDYYHQHYQPIHYRKQSNLSSNNGEMNVNLVHNFISYEDPIRFNKFLRRNSIENDESKSLNEISFRYEHHREETYANLVRNNSFKSSDYNYCSSCKSSCFDNESCYYEEASNGSITIFNFDDDHSTDDKNEYEDINQNCIDQSSSSQKHSRSLRKQLSNCFSSTTQDIQSVFKKFSCFKRMQSVIDSNQCEKTTEKLLKKKYQYQHHQQNNNHHRLTYDKNLTKSDIIHFHQFEQEQDLYDHNIDDDDDHYHTHHDLIKNSQPSISLSESIVEEINDINIISNKQRNEQLNPVNVNLNSQQKINKFDHTSLIGLNSIKINNNNNQNNTHLNFSNNLNDSEQQNHIDNHLADHNNTISENSLRQQQNFLHDLILIDYSPEYYKTLIKMIANNSHQQNTQHQNQPSYVNISRVNHGYVPYNRYSSEYRRDDTLLRSPEDRYSSLPVGSSKGFLHKKVESLYGETFADDWNKSRVKKEHSIEKSIHPAETSPSNQIKSTLASSKLFKKINSIDNSELDDKKHNSFESKDWWLREHQPQTNKNHHGLDSNNNNEGRIFMDKMQEQKIRIQNNIQQGEKWLTNPDNIPEECIGKIRSAIGKANLLLNKKFEQFHKLCHDSINQTDNEQFKIKNDDLQGFWDMVMIQIDDIDNLFNELITLEKNQWKTLPNQRMNKQQHVDSSNNIKTINSKRIAGFNSSRFKQQNKKFDTNNNNNADNNKSRTANDIKRQQRLNELKKRGKMLLTNNQNNNDNNEDDIHIFAPSK